MRNKIVYIKGWTVYRNKYDVCTRFSSIPGHLLKYAKLETPWGESSLGCSNRSSLETSKRVLGSFVLFWSSGCVCAKMPAG